VSNSSHDPTPGARPTGVSDPDAAAQNIQQMFDAIAPRYDLLNHLLSAGIDRLWWRRTARVLRPILARPEAVVLDLCCGTGDMTLALDKLRPKLRNLIPQGLKPPFSAAPFGIRSTSLRTGSEAVPLSKTSLSTADRVPQVSTLRPGSEAPHNSSPEPILAVDFSHNMLALAQPKFAGRNIRAIEADALHLPFADASIDLVTCAFGFRNLSSYTDGLAELHRVLRPDGQIAILDFNQPTGLMGALYSLYFKRVLPLLGRIISRDPRAYTYLPESVARFPTPPRMMEMIAAVGFTAPTWTPYTFGIAGLYRATKL
jgi:demethylmenaquinone methyltransferase/2-methoxy-6-polyprenyl-1,4-benzoquinol methylase